MERTNRWRGRTVQYMLLCDLEYTVGTHRPRDLSLKSPYDLKCGRALVLEPTC